MVRCRFGRICNLKSEISAAQNSRRAFWDLRRAFLGFVKARMAGFEAVCNLILGFCNHPQMTKPKQISACKPRTIFGMVSARFCHLLRATICNLPNRCRRNLNTSRNQREDPTDLFEIWVRAAVSGAPTPFGFCFLVFGPDARCVCLSVRAQEGTFMADSRVVLEPHARTA
jgi:hypothetical protein